MSLNSVCHGLQTIEPSGGILLRYLRVVYDNRACVHPATKLTPMFILKASPDGHSPPLAHHAKTDGTNF